MPEKKKRRLNSKIILQSVSMAMVICIAVCISGLIQYRNSIYHAYNSFAYHIADVAASYVDGNTIATYPLVNKTDEKYDEMTSRIYNLYSKSKVASIYICIPNVKDMTLTNVYDSRINDAEDKAPYALGVVDPIGGTPDEVVKVFQTGERSSDYFIRKTKFGYNTSAIVPLQNDAGNVTALLVVDIPMLGIKENMLNYLVSTIIITILVVAVFVAVLQFMLKRQVIKPLEIISKETADFTQSEKALSDKLTKIKTNDEIETLADSILKMEKDINAYIDNITAITAEKERIGAELSVATHIQASMLPCIFPAFPGRTEFDVYATMTPAKEVGGDFYDFFMIDDDHFAMVMADVSGKGVPAALFMVIAKTLIKNVAQLGTCSVNEILQRVNNLLCENNEENMFVTVWLGILEISTGKLTAANAGHEYPAIKKYNGDFELFKDKHGFVLAGMDGARYKSYEMTLEKGDRLFLYTDGVPEATNAQNELFDTERMIKLLNENKNSGLTDFLPKIKSGIDAFVGNAPQFDDITMMIFEYMGKDNK